MLGIGPKKIFLFEFHNSLIMIKAEGRLKIILKEIHLAIRIISAVFHTLEKADS